jgi:hypothetical protein
MQDELAETRETRLISNQDFALIGNQVGQVRSERRPKRQSIAKWREHLEVSFEVPAILSTSMDKAIDVDHTKLARDPTAAIVECEFEVYSFADLCLSIRAAFLPIMRRWAVPGSGSRR